MRRIWTNNNKTTKDWTPAPLLLKLISLLTSLPALLLPTSCTSDGYRYSTEHDYFKLHQLLYIKSFALLNFEARKLTSENENA